VITIVKVVVVEAVRKVEIAKRFPRASFARLFHSLSPGDRFLFFPAFVPVPSFLQKNFAPESPRNDDR
jgi:hypothetical protein